MKQSTKLEELLRPTIQSLGYELWAVELVSQGRHSLLRIYIDSAKGITVGDCELVSHHASGILDVEDPIRGQYRLEVSSPGLERPLIKMAHYQAYIGKRVQIRVRQPVEGRRKWIGELLQAQNDQLVFKADEHEWIIPFSQIEKGNLVAEF